VLSIIASPRHRTHLVRVLIRCLTDVEITFSVTHGGHRSAFNCDSPFPACRRLHHFPLVRAATTYDGLFVRFGHSVRTLDRMFLMLIARVGSTCVAPFGVCRDEPMCSASSIAVCCIGRFSRILPTSDCDLSNNSLQFELCYKGQVIGSDQRSLSLMDLKPIQLQLLVVIHVVKMPKGEHTRIGASAPGMQT
jgi:hypothetical protein